MNLLFTARVRDFEFHLDPYIVRRKLLIASHGRIWDQLHDANNLKIEIELYQTVPDGDPEVLRSRLAIAEVSLANLEGMLATAAFAAFDLEPVNVENGNGTTELEVLEVLKLYMEYAEGKE